MPPSAPSGMQGPGSQMGSQMPNTTPRMSTFSTTQLHQLRAQIMAYKYISRSQQLPDHLRVAVEGKRPFGPTGRPPGKK